MNLVSRKRDIAKYLEWDTCEMGLDPGQLDLDRSLQLGHDRRLTVYKAAS